MFLLPDVFQNSRSVSYKHYHVDLAWYDTAPGLSLVSMLENTGVNPNLLTDYNMILKFEKGHSWGKWPVWQTIC